ncbi:Transcription factor NFAt subunit NF45 [Fasciola hepatica]|uniref:Transcription factor NFAt subunit NF45 n=1 Tax=Fasciola hepatica TaxID=6192 RepID=A0A4E0RJ77_FASHE|nr:Transcription factor NFAt subunit NF45 [Fasciola hepatica]
MAVRSPMRGFYNRNRPSPLPPFIAQLPYDLFVTEPKLSTSEDDQQLTELLLEYHNTLTPSSSDLQSLTHLVNRVCAVIESLIVNPAEFTSGQIEEVKCVGSFKLGTWLNKHNTADLVVILRTLPTTEAVKGLQSVLKKRLDADTKAPKDQCVVSTHAYGFSVSADEFSVRAFLTTTPVHLSKADPSLHIPPSTQKMALSAIKQTRWLEENASHTAVKVITRIMKDFRARFQGFRYLSSWMINLLAYYVVMQNPSRQALPVHQAFRRLFQLLSAGLFLPGSAGVIDPCEPGNIRLHTALSLAAQDELCCTAQTLLRVLLNGGYQVLFHFDENLDGATREQFLKAASEECKVPTKWSEMVGLLPGAECPSPETSEPADSLTP